MTSQTGRRSLPLTLRLLFSNPLVTSWLDGTAILEASNAGRSGADCARTFGKCSLDVASWVAAIQ